MLKCFLLIVLFFFGFTVISAEAILIETPQMPVTAMVLSSESSDYETITAIDQDNDINPFIVPASSAVAFLREIPSGGVFGPEWLEYLISRANLTIFSEPFTSVENIDNLITPLEWNSDLGTMVVPSNISPDTLKIMDGNDSAAFSINLSADPNLQELVNNAKYIAFFVEPTINKSFKVRVSFKNPDTGEIHTTEINFKKKLVNNEKRLVVINFDALHGNPDYILNNIDFRFAIVRDIFNCTSFTNDIAGYISKFCFIGSSAGDAPAE
jgi:hypothetical protein